MPSTRPTPAEIDALFAAQRAADPLGTRVHLFFAAAFVFFAAWPTSFVDWALLGPVVCFAIRMGSHYRILGPLWWDRLSRLAVVWAVWIALSGLWSAGTWRDWTADAGSLRYALAIPLLYPVLDRRRVLIAALMLGFLCGELSQLMHFTGLRAHIGWMTWHRDPARISGWWDPVVGGSLLSAALGLFMGTALRRDDGSEPGGTKMRRFAAVMVPTTLLAIFATGTRGAWIAAALLIPLAVVWGLRARNGGASREALLVPDSRGRVVGINSVRIVAITVVAAMLVVAGIALMPKLRDRFDAGYREVARAFERRDYTSDTGQRLSMWMWAGRAFKQSPIIGVGAGGYKPLCNQQLAAAAASGESNGAKLPAPHAHAHSWPLHTLATLGLVGCAILASLWITAFRACRDTLAVPLALLGLTFAGLFDTIHVNQQTACMFYILLALSIKSRPSQDRAGAISIP